MIFQSTLRKAVIGFALVCLVVAEAYAQAISPAVSAGLVHSVALKNDGTVRTWGYDGNGQLGRGTALNSSLPLLVAGLPRINLTSVGIGHVLAVAADGTLWAWGFNFAGQLGDGGKSTINSIPTQVPGMTGVIAVAGGNGYTVAVKSDGSVWAWGRNDAGQLGDGTTINKGAPTLIPGVTGVVAVAAGPDHTLALKQDGTVWTWGNNMLGQLGDGTTASRTSPAPVPGLSGVVAIAAGQGYGSDCCYGGRGHSLALTQDGRVWAWGYNDSGQLGDGTTITRLSPVRVQGLSGVTRIAAGGDVSSFSVALRNDGTVWAWGENRSGQLGTISSPGISVPVQVSGLSQVTAIAAGGEHTLVRRSDGTAFALGKNASGQLGNGVTSQSTVSPVMVKELTNVSAVAAGFNTSVALTADGSFWVWGDNGLGELSNSQSLSSSIPVPVAGLTGITSISATGNFVLALRSDGTVWNWGSFTGPANSVPAQVPGLTGVIAIAVGVEHAVALKSNGTVWTWGSNGSGQLGTGNMNSTPTPTQVLSGASAIAAGSYHTVALMTDGTLRAWGDNAYGQLGDGTQITRFTPITVVGLSGVTKIFTHVGAHTGAATSDGTLWTWGSNISGELGDGTTVNRSVPVQVAGFSNVQQCSMGGEPLGNVAGSHSVCVKTDGSVWVWGDNRYGQLGDGTLMNRLTPTQIADFSGSTSVSAGPFHTIAVKSDGTVWSSGLNVFGELGDGTYAHHATPQLVISETGSDFLDLNPQVANVIPPNKMPAFFIATYKSGGLSATSLYADIRGLAPSGSLASAANVGPLAASAYNVYVAAAVPYSGSFLYYQLDSSNRWSALAWPMADFMRGVALGSQDALVRVNILQNVDLSPYLGTSILVGYGTDPDEMVANARYRTIFTVTLPQ